MMSEDDIVKICDQYKIKNYTINLDMSIDVDGDVFLSNKNLTSIPVKFNKVAGGFSCSWNNLTSLEGCPTYVGLAFLYHFNNLTSMEYCPKHIGHNFNCQNNHLTTLSHLPMNFYIGGFFSCNQNNIEQPSEFGRLFFGYIGGKILTGYGNLTDFLNKYKNPPKKDLPKILSELRKITL